MYPPMRGTQGWTSGANSGSLRLRVGVGGAQEVRDVGKVEGFGKHAHPVTISHAHGYPSSTAGGPGPQTPAFSKTPLSACVQKALRARNGHVRPGSL